METRMTLSNRVFILVKDLLLFIFICGALFGINPVFFAADISSGRVSSLLPFVCVFAMAYISGEIGTIMKLPRILCMIFGGIVLGNCVNIKFNPALSFITRTIAMCTILIEGGIELDPQVLKKTSRVCLQLCFIPLAVDTTASALLALWLIKLPLKWGFLLGFTLSAACAAIIVPSMMDLQSKNIGKTKGIPSIILAASSMDDVVAIAGFGIVLGYAFHNDKQDDHETKPESGSDLLWLIVKGPLQILGGLCIGYLFGTFIGVFSSQLTLMTSQESTLARCQAKLTRLTLLFSASLASIFISESLDMAGIGPLFVLTGAFCAAPKLRVLPGCTDDISNSMHILWSLMMPFLFGVMGAEFRFADLDPHYVRQAVILVTAGGFIRVGATYLCLWGSSLNKKEKLFVSITWLAKAAVQGTLAPIVYETATRKGLEVEKEYGQVIRTVAVISVLISSPIAILGLKFLPKYFLEDEGTSARDASSPPPATIIVNADTPTTVFVEADPPAAIFVNTDTPSALILDTDTRASSVADSEESEPEKSPP